MRLAEALGLGPSEIVTLVGGGGKTTAMYALALEAAATGGRAIATGTTLFTRPPRDVPIELVLVSENDGSDDEIAAALDRRGCAIVATGHGTKGRLMPVAAGEPARLLAAFGLSRVVVEGDGSRGRPFKAPAEHEPVVAESSTLVVAVAGLGVLGQPLDEEHVHRPERIAAITGGHPGDLVTAGMMATALAHSLGGRKNVEPGCRFAVLLNQADAIHEDAGRELARRLLDAGVERVVLSRLEVEPVIVGVIR